MHRLILFRHGKTEARAVNGEDIDRALTERGRDDAAHIGRALAKAGLSPDLVLVSPAARARQTWDQASPAFPGARVELRRGLYDATPEEVAEELESGVDAAGTVMVVGHNPSLQELAVNLLIDGGGAASDIERLSAGFPTSTAAAFVLDGDGGAQLEALFHPRDMDCSRGIA